MEFKCCECGHSWRSRTNPNPIQCPNPTCKSTAILPMEEYKELLDHVKRLNPIPYPRLEAFIMLLVRQGVLPRKFGDKMVIIKRLMEEAGWL